MAFEGILSESEIKDLQEHMGNTSKEQLLIELIAALNTSLQNAMETTALGGDIHKKVALSTLLEKLNNKGVMDTEALKPEHISVAIRQGQRIILSPVDADSGMMEVEVREAYPSILARRVAWYEANKEELMKRYKGMYVLVQNYRVAGVGRDPQGIAKIKSSPEYVDHEDTFCILVSDRNPVFR